MDILGYAASALVGISLGLIGGGGSILTVPVMVYLFGLQPLLATSYSLFIVGSTSLVGAVDNYRKGLVNINAALFFGSASVITVFLTRKYLIPIIPYTIANISGITITEPLLTMVMFAALMFLASVNMIRNQKIETSEKDCPDFIRFFKLVSYGIIIGLVTGLLGAGGGFLLIPALVLVIKIPMKKAIGTSLFIVALNSLIGFAGDLGHFQIDWFFLFKVTLIAIAGVFIGGQLSKKVGSEKLRIGFGWFVLTMSIYIIIKEVFLKS